MTSRWIAVVLVLGIAVLGFIAWDRSHAPAQQESAADEPATGTAGESPHGDAAADPGIEWEVPRGWSTLEDAPMRLATYRTEAAAGAAPAECRVHYFGPGQGGTIEANLDRWISEFEDAKNPERTMLQVSGLRVARVRLEGKYASHGGGMGGDAAGGGEQELLGAIVEAPKGPVFFKLVGPIATVDRQVDEFDRMIASVRTK